MARGPPRRAVERVVNGRIARYHAASLCFKASSPCASPPTGWARGRSRGPASLIDERPAELDTYRSMRDPARTPEPFGARVARSGPAPVAASGPRRLFVVQKHDARRLHYDLRLEMSGVLK